MGGTPRGMSRPGAAPPMLEAASFRPHPGNCWPVMSQPTGLVPIGSAAGMVQLVPLQVDPPEGSSGAVIAGGGVRIVLAASADGPGWQLVD